MNEEINLLPNDFQINPSRPIYEQFVEQIRARVVRGLIPAGSRLPSVRELAAEKRINPTTAARTYQELERMKLIETFRGQGTFITRDDEVIQEARRMMAVEAVRHFQAVAESLGLTVQEMIQISDQEGKR